MKTFTLLTAVLLFTACSTKNGGNTAAMEVAGAEDAAAVEASAPAAQGLMDMKDAPAPPPPPAPDANAVIPQKIIRDAVITYGVKDFNTVKSRIAAVVSKHGGYIANERQQNNAMEWRSELEIKVPSGKFSDCVDALVSGVARVDEKKITSTDVTEQYVDLDARMRARQETEKRYLQLLQQAKNVKEILEVEVQLKQIREEIESAKGRLQYFDHHVAYSTITLTYYETFSHTNPQAPGFFERVGLSLADGWNNLLALGIAVLSAWPLWVAIVFIFIFIKRAVRRRKARKTGIGAATNVNP
ncbi:DUF4349 domain-containing protein [Chitinophaga solisilvae]|uniref:DUF4349 domain-containing protein n=1 Tax=Chitinophaga solisilvae TaxID=1233460 RepID=UPI001367C7F4|nr:DUF4349 domain-containing protein [Chitinophaga solisilvae]